MFQTGSIPKTFAAAAVLRRLQAALGPSYLLIAHDLDVVRHLSDRILVLYRGQVMEAGDAEVAHRTPSHPYTRALLDAGCPFEPRCLHPIDICRRERPELGATRTGARAACHRWRELDLSGPADVAEVSLGSTTDRRPQDHRPI